jgi:hypothetical protein
MITLLKKRQVIATEDRLNRLCVNAKRRQRFRFLKVSASQTTTGRLSGVMIRI